MCCRKDDRVMRPICRLFRHNFVHAYVHHLEPIWFRTTVKLLNAGVLKLHLSTSHRRLGLRHSCRKLCDVTDNSLFLAKQLYVNEMESKTRCRAVAGRTARCRCKFRHISKFTAASRGFSATARLFYLVIHQRPFKCWNFTKYADFHGRDVKSRRYRKSRHTIDKSHNDRYYRRYR